MAVISVPFDEPWIVSRRAFRFLLKHVMSEELSAEDRYAIEQAIALDGLGLDLKEPAQRTRLAKVIGRVADQVRLDLHNGSLDFEDPHNEFPGLLAELEMKLSDLYK